MEQESKPELKISSEFKIFAVDIAQKAGKIIRENFKESMTKEWKADNSPVTATDLAINQLVLEMVKERFPEHGIISEEGSNFHESNEYIWICDPIDGTTAFSHGVPTCAFSLALTRNGESILGVVYDPFIDRMFTAQKGGGAFLNDAPIRVSSNEGIKQGVVGLQLPPNPPHFPKLREALRSEQAKILSVGSTIYMGALVASGKFIANIFSGDKPHDAAALKILVEEAGGKATNLSGEDQRYDHDIQGLLVSNGLVHDKLLSLLKETREEK